MPKIAVWPVLLLSLLAASCGGFPGLTDADYRDGYAEGYTKACVSWPADKARSLAAENIACETAPPSGDPEYKIGWQAGFRQALFLASNVGRPVFEPFPQEADSGSTPYAPLFDEPQAALAGGARP